MDEENREGRSRETDGYRTDSWDDGRDDRSHHQESEKEPLKSPLTHFIDDKQKGGAKLEEKDKDTPPKKTSPIKVVLAVAAVFVALIGGIYIMSAIQNSAVDTTYYSIHSAKVETPIRAVVLADLHQKEFGSHNDELLDKIAEVKPDIILIAGDTLTSSNPDISYAVDLCSSLMEIAPVYFGMGNHENRVVYGMDLSRKNLEKIGINSSEEAGDFSTLIKDNALFDGLEDIGVVPLQNSSIETEIKGYKVLIGGVSTALDGAWTYSGDFIMDFAYEQEADLRILMSHFPEPAVHNFESIGIDLILSGHNHGGIVRLPGIGGVFSGGEGLFPEYDAGLFTFGNTNLIVSRGLGGHGPIPRLFNPPELVIVDIM